MAKEKRMASAIMAFAKGKGVTYTPTGRGYEIEVAYSFGEADVVHRWQTPDLDRVAELFGVPSHTERDVRTDANGVNVTIEDEGPVDTFRWLKRFHSDGHAAEEIKAIIDEEAVAFMLWELATEDGVPGLLAMLRCSATKEPVTA